MSNESCKLKKNYHNRNREDVLRINYSQEHDERESQHLSDLMLKYGQILVLSSPIKGH